MKQASIKKCRQCKQTFASSNKKQLFCKDNCRLKNHRQKARSIRLKCENPECNKRTQKQFCKDCVVIISKLINKEKDNEN